VLPHPPQAGAFHRYVLPSRTIAGIKALRPGQWRTIQSYVLVTGTNPSYTSNETRWDCRSPDPKLHWTNDNERYCYKDWKTIVKAVAAMPDITVTDPLTVGIAFGRPARYPDPVVNISRPADNSTVSGTVPVSGTARPQGGTSIARVQVRVDHRAAQPATGIRNWTASINTTLLTNGTHTITATATDSKGNVGTASVTIKVANPAVLSGPSAHPGVLAGGVTADLWSVAGP
jgi:hypothetical protein